MAPTEMNQNGPPLYQAPLGTPPDSPSLPASHSFTLADVQQFIDMVKAIVTMHNCPDSLNPHCHCSRTPFNSPAIQISSSPVTWEDLKQLLLKVIQEKSNPQDLAKAANDDKLEDVKPKKEIARASKLEFKTVNEVWNDKQHKYEIVESIEETGELDELDEYVFVVRMRIDKKTEDETFYIDINSEQLQEILKEVLQGVKGICLDGEEPMVERNLLYHYLTDLEAHRKTMEPSTNPLDLSHLDLLIKHIKEAYAFTTQRLTPLLHNGEIIYDLLWALFKPNSVIYTTCPGTRKPRCIKYDFGEEKTVNDTEFFHIDGRCWDFNGEMLGETNLEAGITKFRGAKRINTLALFPLEYHPDKDKVKAELTKCGRKFISLRGTHHLQYRGTAFRMEKGRPTAISVDGKIMVDAELFQKMNPNYARPSINIPQKRQEDSGLSFWQVDEFEISDPVKINKVDPEEANDNDLLLCSPTVLGFSLNNKLWLEFAVADITPITWNPLLFDHLAIQPKKKKLILALTKSHVSQAPGPSFDDFVVGKGRGLIMLLYGPPGVGKTLTAEGLAEHLKKPLYIVSAGDLGNDAKELEIQLSSIFELANCWNALLLLDEADVYLRARSFDHTHNSLVSVFLRKLEYYQGIMFLTTNRVTDFDEAMQSRIHLTLKYSTLNLATRKGIWTSFLKMAETLKGEAICAPKELEELAGKRLNGREIKNVVRAGHALAVDEGSRLCYSHLETVLDSGKEFEADFKGAGQIDNLRSYM